jgi:hypothetical protein
MTPRDDHGSAARSLSWHGQKPAADTTAEGRNGQVVTTAPLLSSARSGQPYTPQWLRAVDDHPPLLDHRRWSATAHYLTHPWYRVPKALMLLTGRGIRGCWRECTYCLAGAGKVADAIYSFTAALDHERAAKLALGTPHQYRGAERHVNAKTWRRRIIGIGIITLAILGLWLGFSHPSAGALTGIGVAAALDAIGRRGRVTKTKPAARPQGLQYGQPGSVLWGQVTAFLQEEGLDHAITVAAVRPDLRRSVYYIDITTYSEIEPKLLRALEKRIYVPEKSIRVITEDSNAANKTLVITLGNPLANVPEAPWILAGSVSGWSPLDLGLSADPNCPYDLVLVMRHIMVVSKTRGGKTTVHINNIIDRLSATMDTICCGGSLVKSAVFDSWRSVLYKKAETVEQMVELLTWTLDEIQRRDHQLKEINSDDDPDNDVDKWNASLGPAIVLILDEFPEIAEYDGTKVYKKDKPNLLDMVKRISRTGAGLGVSLILGVQASGNQDWGSSVLTKQTSVTIIGPVSEDDTVALLGKAKRDQGYAPHLLRPADEHNHNDAGMAVIDGPGFGSDYVRGYAPFKVKARAIRREQEWAKMGNRPMLPIESHTAAIVMDAETVPPALAAVDAALKHHGVDILSSALVIKHANAHGENWTASTLADALKKESPTSVVRARNGRCRVSNKPLQCFHRSDLDAAFRSLEGSA